LLLESDEARKHNKAQIAAMVNPVPSLWCIDGGGAAYAAVTKVQALWRGGIVQALGLRLP